MLRGFLRIALVSMIAVHGPAWADAVKGIALVKVDEVRSRGPVN